MMLDARNLGPNVRRLAGMHLVSLERLARYVGISRQTLQAVVARDLSQRSFPKADTAIKLAQGFGVSLNALYSDAQTCLREAVEHLYEAPITGPVAPAEPDDQD